MFSKREQGNSFCNASSAEAAFVPQTNLHAPLLLDWNLQDATYPQGTVGKIMQIALSCAIQRQTGSSEMPVRRLHRLRF